MKKNILTYIKLSLAFIFCCIASFLFIQNNRFNDILNYKKEFKENLFNKNYNLELECYEDLLGLSIHGDIFGFYRYHISENIDIGDLKFFPNYLPIFSNKKLYNEQFSYWKPTPISTEDKESNAMIAFYGNLYDKTCAEEFMNKKYLEKSGSYYSYFGAYPVGSYVFVLYPKENTLFVIWKKD